MKVSSTGFGKNDLASPVRGSSKVFKSFMMCFMHVYAFWIFTNVPYVFPVAVSLTVASLILPLL